jgi:hypothetical protein
MSPNPPPLSFAEINGRLNALKTQRDYAMDTVVLQSGEIERLREQLTAAEKELATLKGPPLTSEIVGGYSPVVE